jgi:tetratricopeptide (TPR) repeat protein
VARVFRLLGLHAGPDVAAPAVASLAGLTVREAEAALATLAQAHHVTEQQPGRYAFHDLLRAYAVELVHRHDPRPERQAALRRELDHYLHTSHAAALRLNAYRESIPLPPAEPGAVLPDVSDPELALAWFTAEHPVLLAAIDEAARTGFDEHAWQLAWAVEYFFDLHDGWQDWATTQSVALDAAQRLGDRPAQALAHRGLARACIRLDRVEDAYRHLRDALALLDGLDDRAGQAHTHRDLAWLLERQGRHAEALRHAQQALASFRSVGHHTGEARALNAVGWLQAKLGDTDEALGYCQRAIDLQQRIGDHFGAAETWDSLGYVHRLLGRHEESAACYQQAIEHYRSLDDRYNEADTLASLGDAHLAAGRPDTARSAWRQALAIMEELGHADAQDVRARLEPPAEEA